MGTATQEEQNLNAKGLQIAVLVSRYNKKICDGLLDGALGELNRLGLSPEELAVHRVPGAFELPWLARVLAETKKFDAVVCLGVVIRGETSHFDYICQGATQGLIQAMQDTGVPMAFGVLTTDNEDQALARASKNENNKGVEAARTAVEMALLKRNVGLG